MKKIVFILNNIDHPTCKKRINEFKEHEYAVEVYGFSRYEYNLSTRDSNEYNILGSIHNKKYFLRIFFMFTSIRRLLKAKKNEDFLLYFFGLDIAILASLMTSHKYIFEEMDLVHTYIKNKIIRTSMEKIDKYIIFHSFQTVLTSEGFAKFHFGNIIPGNISIIPNRLSPSILQFPFSTMKSTNISALKIGFVGGIRFKSILFFAEYFVKNYPNNEFHFYGNQQPSVVKKCAELNHYSNCYFHGPFKNPNDLPSIYSNIDLVLSTYDTEFENVKYAEPNKIYESIYFETPIIVSSGTFLSEKVKLLDIGYVIDPLNQTSINDFIEKLSIKDIQQKIANEAKIPKSYCINSNDHLFKKLKQEL